MVYKYKQIQTQIHPKRLTSPHCPQSHLRTFQTKMMFKYKYKKHPDHNTLSSILVFENQKHLTLVCACDSPFAVSLLVSFMGQLYFMRVCVSVTSIFAWVCAYVPLSVLCVFFNSDAFLGICVFLTYSLLFLCLKVIGV